jgi:N-acetylglucosaminyl-diphospho-decaprenol L-rhamnosyltransferase
VARLLERLEAHPRAALAAPRLVSADGSTQCSLRGWPTPVALMSAWLRLDALCPHCPVIGDYRRLALDYDRPHEGLQPMASAWLVRRDAWNEVGPFDPRFPLFFNDVDWCLRAKRLGWEIWYTPEATVEHRLGASTSQVKPRATWESHRALVAFYKKHYADQMGGPLLVLVSSVIVFTGAVRSIAYFLRNLLPFGRRR